MIVWMMQLAAGACKYLWSVRYLEGQLQILDKSHTRYYTSQPYHCKGWITDVVRDEKTIDSSIYRKIEFIHMTQSGDGGKWHSRWYDSGSLPYLNYAVALLHDSDPLWWLCGLLWNLGINIKYDEYGE